MAHVSTLAGALLFVEQLVGAAKSDGADAGGGEEVKGSRRGCNGDGGALASAGQLDYHRYYALLLISETMHNYAGCQTTDLGT